VLKTLGTNTLLIDERTMRLLIEDIDMLKEYIEGRTNHELWMDKENKKSLEKACL
jgi:hypothetical protein